MTPFEMVYGLERNRAEAISLAKACGKPWILAECHPEAPAQKRARAQGLTAYTTYAGHEEAYLRGAGYTIVEIFRP